MMTPTHSHGPIARLYDLPFRATTWTCVDCNARLTVTDRAMARRQDDGWIRENLRALPVGAEVLIWDIPPEEVESLEKEG
jgi:hypothetical protein